MCPKPLVRAGVCDRFEVLAAVEGYAGLHVTRPTAAVAGVVAGRAPVRVKTVPMVYVQERRAQVLNGG